MEIRAYNELYLSDAQNSLANFFDYLINDCEIDLKSLTLMIEYSKTIKQFEKGNPSYISGRSGIELARNLIEEYTKDYKYPDPVYKFERTPEFWLGYVLAYYNWSSDISFKKLFDAVSIEELLGMYNVFHEMDILNVVEAINVRIKNNSKITNLKKIRSANNLSQRELANLSGVNLRSIQLYEQRVNDINKAEGMTLLNLASALNVDIEDLLEINLNK